MNNQSIEVGDAKELVVENLDRQDFVKYAGASGDFNPIHYAEPFAESAGYPSVFGQGMLVAALASNVVTEWFGVASLEGFRVRFEGQVWPGDTVSVTGTVASISDAGTGSTAEIDLSAVNDEDHVLLSGNANVRL